MNSNNFSWKIAVMWQFIFFLLLIFLFPELRNISTLFFYSLGSALGFIVIKIFKDRSK